MASTYSPTLRLELIGNGEQAGTWGTTTNTNLGSLLEQAITGVQTITMGDATYTLSSFDGAVDEARNAVLVLGGTVTTPQNVIAPAVEKTYIIKNGTGANVTIKTSGGNGVTFVNNQVGIVYCDGTNFFQAVNVNSITGNVAITGSLSATGNVAASTNLVATANVSANNATFTGTVTAGTFAGITGRVVQIVSNKYTNSTQTTSTSYVDTFNTVTITPTSANSKILLFAESLVAVFNYAGYAAVRMIRNDTANVVVGDHLLWGSNGFNQPPYQTYSGIMLHCVDQPNTTSAVTYKVQLKSYSSGPQVLAVYGMNDANGVVFTAMEVL